MGKLRVFSGTELTRLLETKGFRIVRKRGSHLVLQKQTVEGTVTLPIPNHREIRIGTLRAIIRQSGLSVGLFENQ